MSETGAMLVLLGFFVFVICVQIIIVRWLLRVNVIVKHLEHQSKVLDDIRTQTYHTRLASETVARTVNGTEPA